jgi:subtilisin-like proprotein convertase family protein
VYTAQVNQAIPDNDDVGIDSRILVPLSGLPNGIGIRLEYDHPFDSDLRLRLAHEGVVFEIDDVDNTGPFHEFDNRNVGGEWLLNVADTLSSDTGYWTSWEISICGE